MNSKKRPLSASFKKVDDQGTSQRSRPSSARSSGSARLITNSFRSDASNNTDLSVTGTKTMQSRPMPRQRQSLNLSNETKLNKASENNVRSSNSMLKVNQTKEDLAINLREEMQTEPKKNNLCSPSDPIETLEPEKDYNWWENIPKEISFSPSTSLSYSSSRSDKPRVESGGLKIGLSLEKNEPFQLHDVNVSSSIRHPSLNDFLDFSDDLKLALPEESVRKDDKNSLKADGQSWKADKNYRRTDKNSPKSDDSSRRTDKNYRKLDECSRKAEENSRKTVENSRKTVENSRKVDENSRKTNENSRKVEQNSRKTEEHSQKSGQTYRKAELDFGEADQGYKASNFQSKVPVDDWSLPKRSILEQDSGDKENAALTIQRWYRGYKTRLEMGNFAVHKILEEKRALREQHKKEEERENSSAEKQRRREEKARLARQAAIQELNGKRERKKEENKRIAEEELKFLEESGKVTKAKNKATKQKKQAKKKSNLNEEASSIKGAGSEHPSRPGTANTLDGKVEELFQESRAPSLQTGSQRVGKESISEATTSRSERTGKTSVSGTKSTLDDLFESLRQLEEEPADLKNESKKNVYDWLTPSGTGMKDDDSGDSGLKSTHDTVRQSGSNSSLLSQEKLRTIMSFLDEVEQTDQDTVVSRSRDRKTFGEVSPSASLTIPRVDAEKELALLESASAAASDVTNAMMSVKVELEEKKRTNELLQRALSQQREFSLRQARDMEKDAKQRLGLQRQEYESTIQRHLSFIDQLIDDKKILSERCEELVKKLKETDKKYVDKIRTIEESHSTEIKKQKDIMQTAEKLRREKWVKEKSQQIKELTVKGLEPDIQKLIAKHKAELKKLKSLHQAELLESDERAGRRYLHQIEELRDQLEREKETACNRERDLAQTRFQKQMEEEEQAFQQQRRRLYAEIQEEKERLATQAQKQRKELDELKGKLEEAHKTTMESVENSSKRNLDDLEQKHELEMKELQERLEIEKQQWIENYMKKQDSILLQRERELKEGVRESRDKEIELVIRRLEDETALARDECERAAENRIKRVRDKYESEMKELEKSEKSMHEKYTTTKEQSNELEEEVSRLRVGIRNEERKLDDLKKLTEQLQDERGRVVDIIRQEFADRLVTTDEDNKRLKIEMSELRAKHRLEVERITNLKEEEMDEVHKRVRQAISKKEETLNSLRQQKESAEKRADHLEFLLQEQRKKLLS